MFITTRDVFFLFNSVSNMVNDILVRILKCKVPLMSTMTKTFGLHHNKRMLVFYSKLIEKGDLCFDVGANIGKFTKVFSELGAKVVCVEPEEACLWQLHNLYDGNKSTVIVPMALGDYEGEGELMLCKEDLGLSTLSAKYMVNYPIEQLSGHKWTKTESVPVTTLDILILLYGLPKYCKIDVEGFEAQVLNGLSRSVRFMSFEFHKWCFEEAKKCINRILQIGDAEFNFMFGESMKFASRKWMSPKELYKIIGETSYVSDDRFFWGDIYVRSLGGVIE